MPQSDEVARAVEEIGRRDHAQTSEYRIFGPPGTGKTTNLTRQIRRAVDKYGADKVLVTSFSRAAAAELAGRDLPVSPDRIGTLHSHCWHALGGPKIAEAHVDEWNRTHPSWALTPKKGESRLDGEEVPDEDADELKTGDAYLEQLNRLRGRMIDPRLWPIAVTAFAERWTEYKEQNGLLDFCDLIERALRDITVAPRSPSVIFADEAQDLNRMQLSLVRKWGERAEYFIVAGDDDQASLPGAMVLTEGGVEVPVEALDPARHRIVSYDTVGAQLRGLRKGHPFAIARSEYSGSAVRIRAGGSATAVTHNHPCLFRWTGAARDGARTEKTDACNLVPEAMAVPVLDRASRGGVAWRAIHAVERFRYDGPVYGLNVPPHHTYIADGIVTHNCIYGFTGATPEAFLKPEVPADHKIILKQSYRVPRAVHRLADSLIHTVSLRQPKEYVARDAPGLVKRLTAPTATFKSAEYEILAAAERHVEAGNSVMFLATCSYMLRPLISVLRKRGIPFHNPYRRSNGYWNPVRTNGKGSTADRILALLAAHPSFGEGQRDWMMRDLALWVEPLQSQGILQRGAKAKLRATRPQEPVTWATLDGVFQADALESLVRAWEAGPGDVLEWWRTRVTAEFADRVKYPVEIAERGGARALMEPPQVVVGTIHSVKGAQADVVFLAPDLSQAGDAQYIRGGKPRDSIVRLFYVGATRAFETLYICQRGTPLAFDLIETVGLAHA